MGECWWCVATISSMAFSAGWRSGHLVSTYDRFLSGLNEYINFTSSQS